MSFHSLTLSATPRRTLHLAHPAARCTAVSGARRDRCIGHVHAWLTGLDTGNQAETDERNRAGALAGTPNNTNSESSNISTELLCMPTPWATGVVAETGCPDRDLAGLA